MAPDARRVIRIGIDARNVFARLAGKAARLAEAHAETALRTRRDDPSRWRRAGLLWPLFAKDR
jgi:hypothetical protein